MSGVEGVTIAAAQPAGAASSRARPGPSSSRGNKEGKVGARCESGTGGPRWSGQRAKMEEAGCERLDRFLMKLAVGVAQQDVAAEAAKRVSYGFW